MIFDFSDRRERNLNYFAISALYLHAGSSEGLSGFHASDDAPHALAVNRYNLNIIFAIKRLKGRKCFGYFHVYLFFEIRAPAGSILL